MDFIVRRGRGLDPAVLMWLMGTLGVGPGIGDVHFVTSVTSQYYAWLRDDLRINPSKIHYSIAAGEDALTASRNDVLLVTPGAYAESAELDWDKANTHMVGLSGPNVGGDWSEPGVVIYTTGTAVVNTLDVSGQNSQFHNVNIENYGANAACLFALKVNGYGCRFKNCAAKGTMLSAQCGVATAGSLHIAGSGMYPIFENCQIGQDVWGTRTTANSGVIVYNSSGRPNGSDFINCRILSVGDDANCAMVRIATATSSGRGHRFDNCFFYHFSSDAAGGTTLARAFYSPSTGVQKHAFLLKNCHATGIDEWQTDDDNVVMADMPVVGTGGGLSVSPSTVTGS